MTSLHTIYRPDSFDQVLGQDPIVKSLKKVVADQRAHAFIFTGPSGTGKTTLARILANEFAGREATIANIEEFPAADKSGADDVREVLRHTTFRAIGKSPVKAIIVDECHRLSSAAWNVLLKPIEEPAKHVYWMFCTTEPAKIPKTIETRCLRYDLKPLSEKLLMKLLIDVECGQGWSLAEGVLESISRRTAGAAHGKLWFILEACQYCETPHEALQIMRSAGQSKEMADLCRWLLAGRGQTWAEAIKYVKGLDGEAESARIVITAYLTSVLLNTKDDKRAAGLLGLLECFSTPYHTSDKMAPLLYSIGMAIGLDR